LRHWCVKDWIGLIGLGDMEKFKGVRLWPWRVQRGTRYEPPRLLNDEETLLDGEESEEEEEGEEEEKFRFSRGSVTPIVWIALSVVATLGGRRVLRGGFGKSLCLMSVR
jgi:hypothetical protein